MRLGVVCDVQTLVPGAGVLRQQGRLELFVDPVYFTLVD